MRSRHWWSIAVVVLAVVSIGATLRFVTAAPSALAASGPLEGEALNGGGGISYCPTHEADPLCVQDPNFVALKRAGRILSGIPAGGLPKGSVNHITVLPAAPAPGTVAITTSIGAKAMTKAATYYFPSWPSGCNDCDELDINPTSPVYEPGAGYSGEYNFGYNTSTNDDSGTPYIDDYFIDLCGPGAADVTLWYWPYPNNTMNTYTTEPLEGAKTTWDGTDPYDGVRRMRGYMMQLAYNINPGWTYNGMQRSDPHWDATEDWAMRQGLNWEASNHAGTSYFYISDTPDSSKNIKLLANVTDDIKDSNVPVVVLMNARYLPNWSSSGNPVGHYITIVGYNNDTSQYAYVDTCGYWTYCNHNGTNTDGGVHVVDQNTLFSGILSYGNEWFW